MEFPITDETKVTFRNNLNPSENWNSWALYKDCNETEKEQFNLASWPDSCILFDKDFSDEITHEKIIQDYEDFKKKLDAKDITSFLAYESRKGYHVLAKFKSLDKYSEEARKEIAKLYIKEFDCDSAKAMNTGLVAVDGRNHFKTGIIYPILFDNIEGENQLDERIVAEAREIVERNKENSKKFNQDQDFKDYFETDSFFQFIKNNVLPDGRLQRDMIVMPNIAAAAAKTGKTEDEIENILHPIIEKNFPGKQWGEMRGWLRKGLNGELNYNPIQLNDWGKTFFSTEFYDLNPISVDSVLSEEEIKNIEDEELREIEEIIKYIATHNDKELNKAIKDKTLTTRISKISTILLRKKVINFLARKTIIKGIDFQKEVEELISAEEELPISKTFDVLNKKFLDHEYTIKDIEPKGGYLIAIQAVGDAMKSLSAEMLSINIALKTKVGNHFETDKSDEAKTLYCDLERHERIKNKRDIKLINGNKKQGNNYSNQDLERLNEKFHAVWGKDIKNVEQIYNAVKKGKYTRVIIDTLSKIISDDENSNTASAKLFIDVLQKIKDLGVTVIILHHLKKGSSNFEVDKVTMRETGRGASDILNNCDLVWNLYKIEKEKNFPITKFDLIFEKTKDNHMFGNLDRIGFVVTNNESDNSITFEYDKSIKFTTYIDRRRDMIKDLIKNKPMLIGKIAALISLKITASESTLKNDVRELAKIGEIKTTGVQGMYVYEPEDENINIEDIAQHKLEITHRSDKNAEN